MIKMNYSFAVRFALLAACFVWSGAAFAAGLLNSLQNSSLGETGWDIGHFSQSRIIASKTAFSKTDNAALLGVHIKLKPGWKTYWRTPGDSGVPPQFNWTGSTNIKSADIRWPAPEWFSDEYGVSAGYLSQVVFPLELTPVDPTKPMNVKLSLNYAACKDICVPVQAKMSLLLPVGPGHQTVHAGLISKYFVRVPHVKSAAQQPAAVRVKAEIGAKSVLMVDVLSSQTNHDIGVFVEGPAEYYFSRPVRVKMPNQTMQRYKVVVDGGPKGASLTGTKLRITLVEKMQASEFNLVVE